MKQLIIIALLTLSNVFMTFAWYGHLKFAEWKWFSKLGITAVILFSWGFALFEYCFQVPANKFGYLGNGGPFSLLELKMLQEVISIVVFLLFALLFFKTEELRFNHVVGFILLMFSVYFFFKK